MDFPAKHRWAIWKLILAARFLFREGRTMARTRSVWLVGCVAASLAVMVCAAAAQAADVGIVSHVKIVSDKNPDDVSSPEAWRSTFISEGMSDQEKAIAIWRTVTKYRHQENPPNEGVEGGGNVHDPFKTFNVYGYGMCCCAAADIEGLARYIGMPARGRIINNHSVPEVWYDGGWHLLDSSLMFYLIKPSDGKIASVDEMKKDIADWKRDHPEIRNDADWKNFGKNEGWKKGPPLFATCTFYDKDGINRAGWHGWWSNMGEYNYKVGGRWRYVVPPDTKGTVNVFDYGAVMGYQVNVQLREGERLTRRWYAKEAATGLRRGNAKGYQKFLEGDMRALGLQKDFGDLAPGRVGNGTVEYDALADSKLAADAIACENLKVEGGKIRIVDAAKPATLIVRMSCSYVYLNGEVTLNPATGVGGSAKVSISLNNGLDWTELVKLDKPGEQKIDLKPYVFNKYDYRVRLEFAGADAGLDGLKFANDFQHSQAPLPIITEGENKLTFSADGVAEGTVTVQGNMNGPGGDKPGRPLCIGDFHPTVNGADMKRFAIGTTPEHDEKAATFANLQKPFANPPNHGTAIVPVATPGDITRIRLGVHWRARNPADGYTVSASFDKGRTWKEMCKLDLAHPAKSGYFVFNDVPAGARDVRIKFDGTQTTGTEIFDLRIDVDYREPAGGFRPVKVTYTWEEGFPAAAEGPRRTVKTDEHVCMKPGDMWTIRCGPGTVVKSYAVELAK